MVLVKAKFKVICIMDLDLSDNSQQKQGKPKVKIVMSRLKINMKGAEPIHTSLQATLNF